MFRINIFTGRAECGAGWDTWLIFFAIFSEFLIFTAYISIPFIILRFKYKYANHIEARGIIPKSTFILFALFIILCGFGHLWGILVFKWPAYYFYVFWNFLTGIASWATVISLVLLTPKMIIHFKIILAQKEELRRHCDELMRKQEILIKEWSSQHDPPS